MDKLVSVVVPTYREKDNLRSLIERIDAALTGYDYEIIFIDDDSQDGSVELASELSATYPVRIIVRRKERGLASAVVHGFGHARGDIIAVMDADLQHPAAILRDMLAALNDGVDLVIASRYVPGGSCQGWGMTRRIISRVSIFLSHLLLPRARQVRDPVSGFFVLKKPVVSGVNLKPTGYKILLEVLGMGNFHAVAEVPFDFCLRQKGESKLNAGEKLDYLQHLLSLMIRTGELTRFLKFCLVGASGVLVNEGLLWILRQFAGLPLALSSSISIETSIITNFVLNDFFTFPDRRKRGIRSFLRRLGKFNLVSLAGLGINLGVLLLLTHIFQVYYLLANLVGIAAAILWNYLVNLGWTWKD